jgi:hypothetical protein
MYVALSLHFRVFRQQPLLGLVSQIRRPMTSLHFILTLKVLMRRCW